MSARELEDLNPSSPKLIRLQRYLASCGLGSRRACEDFITMGRVTVDGQVVSEQGAQIDPQVNKIALDGQKLKMERKKYFVFNKPPGVLCTNKDPEGRPRVIDFFPKEGPRVFSVGRLDEDSEGLLIVTNDGDLAQKMAHPSYRIFRTYHVLVAGAPTPETLTELRNGIYFDEGRFRVEGVKSIKKQGQSTWCEVVLAEGHNREVRRLFSRVGHKVMKLQRVAFGPIFLGRMARGEIREIRKDEMERLFGMLERNEEGRQETQEKRRPSARAVAGARRQNDGDLLNKTSRNAPPSRNTPTKRSPAPERSSPNRHGSAVRKGPPVPPPRRIPDSSPREERGLGVQDVSDEEMMGLVDRPAGRSGAAKKFASSGEPSRRPASARTDGAFGMRKAAEAKQQAVDHERGQRRAAARNALADEKRPAPDAERGPDRAIKGGSAMSQRRTPADAERSPRRPAKGAPFKAGKSATSKASKGASSKSGKGKRGEQATESFGRRSPGQPKGAKRKGPRGR